MSTTRVNTGLAVTLLMLFAACASQPKVRVDKDSGTNFAAYKTYAWLGAHAPPPAAGQPSAPPAEPNSITGNRVRAAVVAALQAKGYTLNETNPDFRVSYAFNAYERQKNSGMRVGLGAGGGGGGNVSGGVGLSIPVGPTKEMMGSMTIDIIDSARNAQVWTGTYEQKIRGDAISDENTNKLVSAILARFPTDAGKK